jgi:hypothetical protein
MLAWLKKILPKCSLSGKTSACRGRFAPPESTRRKTFTVQKNPYTMMVQSFKLKKQKPGQRPKKSQQKLFWKLGWK